MDPIGQELLSRLVDALGARLVLYAQQFGPGPEDVVQEAFVRLAGQRPAPDEPAAWLYRAVRNGAISAARSSSRRARHEQAAADRRPAWFVANDGEGLDAAAASEALESLPLEQRETLVLRLWNDLSFEEIARLMETSASTAHRRYGQGLAELRGRLGVPRTR